MVGLRGAGVIPWQLNESFPNAWCTSAVDWHGEPKPAYHGVARAYHGAPSAQFATCAWGGLGEVRALVDAPARLYDLDGCVVAEDDHEVHAPLDAFAHDMFVLDVGGVNRYVMSRTENLAPLLDLPPAELVLAGGVLRNVAAVAAIGVVADDVIDLLPGEERTISVDGAEGWNARV